MPRNPKRSQRPKIGVFWIVAGRLVAFCEPLDRVREAAGFKDSSLSHQHLWQAVIRRHSALAGREYWERPRGRVLYSVADDQFRIFLPSSHTGDQQLIRRIAARFSLPLCKVTIGHDEHYEPPSDLLDED